MELETIYLVGGAWTIGFVFGWGITLYMQIYSNRNCEYNQTSLRDAFKECDTCGQIDSNLKGGLCAWCQRVYSETK